MKKDIVRLQPLESSFLCYEKDIEDILRILFVQNQPWSDQLKRLLVINTKDCLSNKDSSVYQDIVNKTTIKTLLDDGYIRLTPKLTFGEHEEVKSYITISFDNFAPNLMNPQFRNCIVSFEILCPTDYWYIGDYRIRPLTICGYIDGLLNNRKLSGIGTLQFAGCDELLLSEDLSGHILSYRAVHGHDDQTPRKE